MHALKTLMILSVSLAASLTFAAPPMKLFPGLKADLPFADVAKVTSSDPAIAEAQPTKEGVAVTAKKEGQVQLKVWKRGAAQPETVDVAVEVAGWNLKKVLLASRDLAEGTLVTKDDFVVAELPAPMVTSSVVKPESASYVLNQKLLVPVQAGDLVSWSAFESPKAKAKVK